MGISSDKKRELRDAISLKIIELRCDLIIDTSIIESRSLDQRLEDLEKQIWNDVQKILDDNDKISDRQLATI